MKTAHIALITTLVAGLGLGTGLAMARGGDLEGYGPRGKHHHMMERGGQAMQERAGARLDALQEKLALRDDQQAAWATYRQGIERRMEQARAQMEEMRGTKRPATTPERMERRQQMAERHLQTMSEMHAATNAFYTVLDEDQRKTFDAQADRRGRWSDRAERRGERGERGERGGDKGPRGERCGPGRA